MAQEIQIPDRFNNAKVAKAFQGRVSLDDNLADGIAQGFPVMHYTGKTWSLRYRGERKTIVRKDDGTAAGHLDIVILQQGEGLAKTYFGKAWDPATADGERPVCSSMNGIVPDEGVPEKQSDSCAICKRNVWKTDDKTGRRGRDCPDHKRLAVLVMPNQTQELFGAPVLDPVFLKVPPDSLNSLASMGDTMTKRGFHYSTYLTRVTFDPQKPHPSMLFRPIRELSDAEGEFVVKLMEDPAAKRIVGTAPMVPQNGPRLVAPAVTAPVTPPPAKVEDEPAEEVSAFLPTPAPAPSAAPAKRGRKPKEVAGPVPESGPQAVAAPPINGHGDNADVDVLPSDDELDNEIASLIKK